MFLTGTRGLDSGSDSDLGQEKTSTYRWYTLLNMLAIFASFATAAGLIISSAISHNPAVDQCRVSLHLLCLWPHMAHD